MGLEPTWARVVLSEAAIMRNNPVAHRLTRRVAIVTGGARGIGAAASERLAQEGAAVVVTDVVDDEGERVADAIRRFDGRAVFEHLDVSSDREWQRAVERARTTFGGLHVLVNNAGVARIEDVETESMDGYSRLIAINQTGVWLGMKAAVPELRTAGGGSIINVSSIYGTVGGNGTAIAYHASKGAVRMMTKSAAIRYAKEKIRVNSVHPAFIDTPMVAPFLCGDDPARVQMRTYIESMTPMGRIGQAREVTGAIAFLASEDATYITGSELYVDGGWTAW
jgi:NAD(P)-dependent dehydrogenase (short-subunit alcohol dehydrogenase family)